jgi:predicted transcriptional regulator
MSLWTEDREKTLLGEVGDARPVSQTVAAAAAVVLEVSTRSVSAKLRKMGVEVEKAGPRARKFSDEQAAALVAFLENNEGAFTYAEIAEQFASGEFSAKQIQGKVLSLELTDSVKKTPKKESVKTYTDEEEATFVAMASAGKYLEDIADALNKSLASVRGKALSLNRTKLLDSIPKQRESHAATKVDVIGELIESGEIAGLTVNEIAEKSGKSPRGVRTIITRRETACSDYKAKPKKAAA